MALGELRWRVESALPSAHDSIRRESPAPMSQLGNVAEAQRWENARVRRLLGLDEFAGSNNLKRPLSVRCDAVSDWRITTVRAFKLALDDRCEDFGQFATYFGARTSRESSRRRDVEQGSEVTGATIEQIDIATSYGVANVPRSLGRLRITSPAKVTPVAGRVERASAPFDQRTSNKLAPF